MKYDQKRVGSLSPSSRETHATQRGLCGIQALSSVVLPKPAGAEMSVSRRVTPAFKRSSKRGRGTNCEQAGGRDNLVVRRGGRSKASFALLTGARAFAITFSNTPKELGSFDARYLIDCYSHPIDCWRSER